MSQSDLETHVAGILRVIDPEPDREGLERTPNRVARALAYLTKGYAQDPRSVINGALFTEPYSEMIVVRDIDFFSLCEHHLLPFFGQAHVAYIPRERIVGISKIARLVEAARRNGNCSRTFRSLTMTSLNTGTRRAPGNRHWRLA